MSVHQLPDGRCFCMIPDPEKKSGVAGNTLDGAQWRNESQCLEQRICPKRVLSKTEDSWLTLNEITIVHNLS